MLLQETKCLTTFIISTTQLCRSMALVGRGLVGGITILWNPNLIDISKFNSTPISLTNHFFLLGPDSQRFLTNMYAPPPLMGK